MSIQVISRTISSVVDQKITLACDQIGRTMNIGSSWNSLRIGMRVAINATYSLPIIAFRIGVCSGTTNMVGHATTTNWVGFSCGGAANAAWTWNVTHTAFTCGNYMGYAGKRVGSSFTEGGGQTLNGTYGGLTANVASKRTGFLIQIVKGSPNYSCYMVAPDGAANANSADVSNATLMNAMSASTIGSARTVLWNAGEACYATGAATIATSETAGAFDTVNIQWGSLAPLEISEVVYTRIS